MTTVKKLGMIFAVIFVCVAMTACSTVHTTVFAESRNKYTVVTTGKRCDIALSRAYKGAQDVCAKQRKELVVISKHTIQYQGARRDLSVTNHKISDIGAATGEAIHFPSLYKEDDYESTMVFECAGSIAHCYYCFPVGKRTYYNRAH